MLELLFFFLLSKLCSFGGGGTSAPIDYGAGNPDQEFERARERRRRAEREEQKARERAKASTRAEKAPEPWPQAVPAGLPAFPSGWEFDEPPSKAVQTRAWQLLDPLWKRGQGSIQQEQTAGNWTTYRAEITRGGKKGVVAYRIKRARAAPAPKPPAAKPPAGTTATRPPAAPSATPASASTPARPLLYQGAGMGALVALQPHVREAQVRLKAAGFLSGAVDGKFGPGTGTAVRAFQGAKGLSVDGKIGPNTWAALDRVPALLAS